MEKTLRDKWIEARDQVKERVSNEMETLPLLDEDSKHILGLDPEEEISFISNDYNEPIRDINKRYNEGYCMDLEDYKELVEFQKKEIAKLKEQKNDLKGRILENIQGVAETSKERDLWKLTSELLYDRLKDALSLLNKFKQ